MFAGFLLNAWKTGDYKSLFYAGLGAVVDIAKDAIDDELNELNPATEFIDTLKDWAKNEFEDFVPDAAELERIENDISSLLNDVTTWGQGVVSDIGDTVQGALGSGEIPAQTDGGLGQTHDDFTPDGPVPMDVGTLPGMETDAVGTSRSDDGEAGDSGGSYGGSGSSASSQGGTTSLGGSGTGSSSPGSGNAEPPTAGDLGIDPNSGDYIEYQPTLNQVVITHADGTTETRPWPPA
ncbi:MAG: hypothetical protein ACRD23_21070 [Terriglobales bacterium]